MAEPGVVAFATCIDSLNWSTTEPIAAVAFSFVFNAIFGSGVINATVGKFVSATNGVRAKGLPLIPTATSTIVSGAVNAPRASLLGPPVLASLTLDRANETPPVPL